MKENQIPFCLFSFLLLFLFTCLRAAPPAGTPRPRARALSLRCHGSGGPSGRSVSAPPQGPPLPSPPLPSVLSPRRAAGPSRSGRRLTGSLRRNAAGEPPRSRRHTLPPSPSGSGTVPTAQRGDRGSGSQGQLQPALPSQGCRAEPLRTRRPCPRPPASTASGAPGGFTVDGHARPEPGVRHHHVVRGHAPPAESHDADAPRAALPLQVGQHGVHLPGTESSGVRGAGAARSAEPPPPARVAILEAGIEPRTGSPSAGSPLLPLPLPPALAKKILQKAKKGGRGPL